MSDHTILRAADAPDFSGDDTPGAFLGYASTLGSEQLGVNVRVLAPGQSHVPPGMDPSTGHSHKDIEEIYVVLEGEVTFKIDDETFVLGPRDAVRVPPEAKRGTRNDGDTEAAMVMVSVKMTDPRGQSEFHPGFWGS
jgi:mannose-6-phosphate isomerase-like protein (cupin superfamily)